MGVGAVYIIGAGPGAPDLISVRGLRMLHRADAFILDAIVPDGFLADLGIDTVGKALRRLESGTDRLRQDEINHLMLTLAREGRTVARVKAGDPFIFGRGTEETAFLSEHGIAWEVVPGLSAATAVPTAAGLPLTERGRGRSFAVSTARIAGGAQMARFPLADSLVVMMGVAVLGDVAAALIAQGWEASAPAAVIERGTQAWERRVRGSLEDIEHAAHRADLASPAVLIVGEAAREAHRRQTILYTGLDPSNFRLIGDVIHWPALRIVERDDAGEALGRVTEGLLDRLYDAVIFTSKVGVIHFFSALRRRRLDGRLLAGVALIAAGPGTADCLSEHGVLADVVPGEPGSAGIMAAIAPMALRHTLLVQGHHAPARLTEALSEAGVVVDRLAVHTVVPNPSLGRPLPPHDVIYFASPSAVAAFVGVYTKAAINAEVWCIGEVTRDALRAHGVYSKVVMPHISEHAAPT